MYDSRVGKGEKGLQRLLFSLIVWVFLDWEAFHVGYRIFRKRNTGGKGKIECRASLVSQNDKDQPFELYIIKWRMVHEVPMVHCDVTTPLYHHSALLWHHPTLLHRCALFYCDIREATLKHTCPYAITMEHCDDTIGLHWSPLLSENTASWLNHGALWCHKRAFWYHIEFVMSQCSLCWHNKVLWCDNGSLWWPTKAVRPQWTIAITQLDTIE